ncbi:uncharacterized protein BJ171DRAFT_421761 [Polychytrium aggregatum]|uniref:uncharacterized protein n=1 Tax=Polychytrium aggregatum TaxID=110093 RepID=UPI0022FF0D7E|nr:uncharacterized protein BJ171DRAFT_421761 [Polychytrium aggregatum]KAI9206669.1 hypothetical protein BJ171DRAFT_421761 [Polychytrium aggregatum]
MQGSGPATPEAVQVAAQLRDAFAGVGVCYIDGHRIHAERQSQLLQQAQGFFDLPQSTKDSISATASGSLRGYIGIGAESGSDAFEVKEAFSYGFPWSKSVAPRNNLQGPNTWPSPDQLPGFQPAMQELFDDMVEVSLAISGGLSLALGQAFGFLPRLCDAGNTISMMRLFRYFPYHRADDLPCGLAHPDRIGSSPHTDWGFLTLIVQQPGVTGLQVNLGNSWVDVPPVEGTIVVNGGDFLSLISGGVFRSPLHRVVSDGATERLSFVLFYYPNYDAKIPVLDSLRQNLSLFDNQSLGRDPEAVGPSERLMPFGEFISNKWSQVQRSNT